MALFIFQFSGQFHIGMGLNKFSG